ncbi:ROK family protein [Xylophilus rhododendri]|uniref:ROK family protein n=1 Tax=Xylophilus rhododendri TaxID=2697032 RepID=A0A857J3Q7_9BURK|nr:ROK family protein [Xylophilus rhododendri]QHI98396.1 ROK family protein [Xylophilus rhododendri]
MRVCVDIGGTKVAVSLSPPGSRELIHRRSQPTAKQGRPDAVARQILQMVDEACAEAGIDPALLERVGVSSAGPFVLKDGMIELATPNICGGMAGPARKLPNDWKTVPIEAPLRQRFAHVRVENDCVAALEAERRWGALQGIADCAYVTWSTGIGMGLCVDGRALRGKNGNAGHGGHTFVSDDDHHALCGCGNHGDLESLVAGNAIGRRFADRGFDGAESLLQAAREGHADAIGIVDALCRTMGRGLYNIVALLDLQRISLGGSVFWHHRDLLLPKLQAYVAGHLPALTAGVELVPAGLAEKVGDYAALALIDD